VEEWSLHMISFYQAFLLQATNAGVRPGYEASMEQLCIVDMGILKTK